MRELDWDDLEHDKEGFVSFNELERYLVHNASLLSRRISKLVNAKPPLLEVADADPASGQHFNAKRVRITKDGERRIQPVWERYRRMSGKLLEGIPQRLLDAHYDVNQRISAEIGRRRSGLSELSVGSAAAGIQTGCALGCPSQVTSSLQAESRAHFVAQHHGHDPVCFNVAVHHPGYPLHAGLKICQAPAFAVAAAHGL